MTKYIPKKGDRFAAIVKDYNKPAINADNCLCKKVCTDYITARDSRGDMREFHFEDFVSVKNGKKK